MRITGGDSVTDLATRPEASSDDAAAGANASSTTSAEPQWAPAEPAAPKGRAKRLLLWIGIPVALALGGAVAASLVLIAPGTTVAGVNVGLMTPGAAAEAIEARLAQTEVTVGGVGGDTTLNATELGATVDAAAAAAAAFDNRPGWNVTQWFGPAETAPITFDSAATAAALETAAPAAHVAPTDAIVAYDPAATAYLVTPGIDGAGIDPASITAAVQSAFDSGELITAVDAEATSITPLLTTDAAQGAANHLNVMIDSIGFYVGDERVVAIDRAVASSWLTVTPDPAAGTFVISADAAAIQGVVDTLPGVINREVVNATVITNSGGDVLRTEIEGFSGRTVGDTSGVANDFAAQLGAGNAVYAVPVTEVPFTTTALARTAEVNLSSQRAYFYENGQLVNSYAISSGTDATPTPTGNFEVFAHVRMQNMGCGPTSEYCTEDVPWVTYFAPDIAFHGAYWHNNFGQQMSHGCVNMPVDVARSVFEWLATGTEVSVHY